jgi:hypothetical protein
MTDLAAKLDKAKETAYNGGVPVRRKDGALYRLLAECLAICETVERDGLQDELRELLRVSVDVRSPEIWAQGRPRSDGNAGRGKRYAEKDSPTPVLVCRYVLEGDARNNPYRYAACLVQAMTLQISSSDLAEWLAENGGLNTLYKTREREQPRVTKTLHLNSQVTVPHSGVFTLTLRRDHRGFFDVLNTPLNRGEAVAPHAAEKVGASSEGLP